MTGKQPSAKTTSLGVYDTPKTSSITGIEVIAIVLSAVWLGAAGTVFLTLPPEPQSGPDSLRFLMTMLAIFMPVAMIWVAATAARSSRIMREESARLKTAIDAIRQAYIAQNQGRTLEAQPSVTRKLDEIATAARNTETALATFHTTRAEAPPKPRPAPPPPQTTEEQPGLALGTQAAESAPPLGTEDFIRALNFPETTEDTDGFAALRRALADRPTAQIVQAAQDVLTLLSQDGIYMDDLRPDRARPEIWRTFAQGARGKAIAALGGVRDRSSLALTAGRMKQDPIFRDAAHHFLRRFDRSFADFEMRATDSEISAFADTRTARAFMLLGRVAGTFD